MPAFESLRSLRRSERKKVEEEATREYEAIQAKRPWFLRSEIPFRLARSTMLYKLGYMTVVIISAILVFNVPKTNALDRHGAGKSVLQLSSYD